MREEEFKFEQDGVVLARAAFGMTFFVPPPLKDRAADVIRVYERLLDLAGRECFTYYSTETMSKDRKVSGSTFAMLPGWLQPDQEYREFVAIILKGGSFHGETAVPILEVLSEDQAAEAGESEESAYIHLGVAPADFEARPDDFARAFADICTLLRPKFASAGYGIETSPYRTEASQSFAVAKSLRHIGLDIFRGSVDLGAVGDGAVKSVNWLTYVEAALIAAVGEVALHGKRSSSGVQIVSLPGGYLFRAGDRPMIGDVNRLENLPAYVEVNRRLWPLVDRARDRSPWFSLADDDPGGPTDRWFRRFELAEK